MDGSRHWSFAPLAAVLVVCGLVLGGFGAWLLLLGGSWYYVVAGLGLAAAGVFFARGLRTGARIFWCVFALTLFWSLWESGLDYWRWVPRTGFFVLLAIAVALAQPRLAPEAKPARSRLLALALFLLAVGAFALAFLPYRVTAPTRRMPAADARIAASIDAQPEGDWSAYGRGRDARRYSALAQIDRGNVAGLRRAWVFRTGDLPKERWGAENTPLKVGDSLYLCTGRNIMISLDAGSGRERWRFDPRVADSSIPYTAACRGVAYYAEPGASGSCAARVIEGTLDGRLVAVDAGTGRPCAGFGTRGEVRITEGMGSTPPGMVSITSAPTIVRGIVVTGHQVLDGQRRRAPSGVIQGYDAVTGRLAWAWDMLHPEWQGAPPPGQQYARGTPNMWTTASADERLGLVYLPLGNSAADYWSGSRSETEDRYTAALVALDVLTGKPVWSFQTVHRDVWDYDLGSQATLVDFPTRAAPVPALLLPSKQGEVYILDRRTGEALMPVQERPVPQGGVEPARRSPTQPFSSYHSLRLDDLVEQDMWGLTPFDQLACRIQFRAARYLGIYTPPESSQHSIQFPAYNGGADWGGVAVDPRRGIVVANYNTMANYNRLVPRAEADAKGWKPRDEGGGQSGAEGEGDPQTGTPYAILVNGGWRLPVTKLPCTQPPYGGIRAIELASGRTLWDRPLGDGRNNGPFGLRSHLPLPMGTPNNGGAAVTAGGLVFIAATTDNQLRAIDIDTGETLWQDTLPAGGQATPMVYEANGRQYLLVTASGHHFMETDAGDYLVAYALPKR
jgi:quinoprotein glucose dehydrogenase